MKRFDKIISLIILGLLAPIVLMLLFWWGSIPFTKNYNQLILFLALAGFVIGVVLDFTLLRRFVFKLFKLPLSALVTVEIFYSIMVYGFFMGFPVFNSLVGIVGNYIAAKNGVFRKVSYTEVIKNTNYITRISMVILFLLCFCSALLALRESTICSQVKGMLNLSFDITIGMIWMLIISGGSFLLTFQNNLSKFVSKRIINKAYPLS